MNIKIIAVGKLSEQFLRSASKEYEKRLSRFCKLEIIEIPDIKNPDTSSAALCEEVKAKEGANILRKLKSEYTIALCVEGEGSTSEAFAQTIEKLAMKVGSAAFIIGGSLGLSDEVKAHADMRMSLSEMTFPHGLTRIVLLEQIYRGYKILNREQYHK